MCYRVLSFLMLVTWLFATPSFAAEVLPAPQVTLKVIPSNLQTKTWPVLLDVHLTNTGIKPISWWCGGPDTYPGAEHFIVEVRYGSDQERHVVVATNGQYVQGSGMTRELKPGESITVPLAIPLEKPGGVSITVRPRDWTSAPAVECDIQRKDDNRDAADALRARVIQSVIAHSSPFLLHIAETYPDPLVIEAMLKLVTLDNVPIASGAATVLARQKTLPSSAGPALGDLVLLWLSRSPAPNWGGLQSDIATAALRTKSAPARTAVLKLMAETKDPGGRAIALNALAQSPGDETWLREAQKAIAALSASDDREMSRQKKWALDWLESRIKNPQ